MDWVLGRPLAVFHRFSGKLGLGRRSQNPFLGKGSTKYDLGGYEEEAISSTKSKLLKALMSAGDLLSVSFLGGLRVEDRPGALLKVISETVIPLLEEAENQRVAEVKLAEGIGLLDWAIEDEQEPWGKGQKFFRRRVELFRRVFELLPKRQIGNNNGIKGRLLSPLVDWWFLSEPEEAKGLFSFLAEVAEEKEDRWLQDSLCRDFRSEKHENDGNTSGLRGKLEDAIKILDQDYRWVRLLNLMGAISALWQRSLGPERVIALSGVSRQLENLSRVVRETLADLAGKIAEMEAVATAIVATIDNDEILHGLNWRVVEIDLLGQNVRIMGDFPEDRTDFAGSAGDLLEAARVLVVRFPDYRPKVYLSVCHKDAEGREVSTGISIPE